MERNGEPFNTGLPALFFFFTLFTRAVNLVRSTFGDSLSFSTQTMRLAVKPELFPHKEIYPASNVYRLV